MKLRLLFLMTATFLAAGCTDDSVTGIREAPAIRFGRTYVDRPSRSGTSTADLVKFHVSCIMQQGGSEPAVVFNRQAVSRENGEWTYTPPQYWFAGWTYDFIAWYPDDADKARIDDTGQDIRSLFTRNGYCLVFDNSETAYGGDMDLIFARKQVSNVPEGHTQAVDLVFGHALSRVRFGFTNALGNDLVSLQVSNIRLDGTPALGRLNLSTGSWTYAEGTAAFNAGFSGTGSIRADGKGFSGEKYLLPTGNGLKATFTVTVFNDGIQVYRKDFEAAVPIRMDPGVSYEVNATIDRTSMEIHEITFDEIEVDVWPAYPDQSFTPVPAG